MSFEGVFPIVNTPFNEDGTIDLESQRRLVRFLIDAGAHGNDIEAQDDADAAKIYDILENEIVPAFYQRDANGIPTRWLAFVRQAIMTVTPRFSTRRMVKEYAETLYAPAMPRKQEVGR